MGGWKDGGSIRLNWGASVGLRACWLGSFMESRKAGREWGSGGLGVCLPASCTAPRALPCRRPQGLGARVNLGLSLP